MEGRTRYLLGVMAASLAVLSLAGTSSGRRPPGEAPEKPYFAQTELSYQIDGGLRTEARLKFELVNEGENLWRYSVSRVVPSPDVTEVLVQSNPDSMVEYSVEGRTDETVIHENVRIPPGETINYTISYDAGGLLSENGPRHRLERPLGVVGATGWRHENLTVEIRGAPGDEPFTYHPDAARSAGENLVYTGKLGQGSSFGGLQGTWYESPAYYRLTLTETIRNDTGENIRGVEYDLSLFNRSDGWQYPVLVSVPPELERIYLDEENNWRAVLEVNSLRPGESVESEIEILQEVEVLDPSIYRSEVGDLSEIPAGFDQYLGPEDEWQSEDSNIREVAENVTEGENDPYLAAKRINRFVIGRLDYEVQEGDRLGSLEALLTGKGDCSEYTDLSIALARAVELPARASYGWGYVEGGLVAHAWPEFYLPNVGWRPADPTWADTGGDIGPGGLRGGEVPPGGGKSAPEPSDSPESYLFRTDSIHLERNLAWKDSSESYGSYTYRGAEPAVGEEITVEVLTEEEASKEFLTAARTGKDYASRLLDGGGDLESELDRAGDCLERAEGAASPGERIEMSKESTSSSSAIIESESEPPSDGGQSEVLPDLPMGVVYITIVAGFITLTLGLWLKSRK